MGCKNKPKQPGQPGYKPKLRAKLPRIVSDDEILAIKVDILELLSAGDAQTVAAAARKLGVQPVRVYGWAKEDEDFWDCVKLAQQVQADGIVAEFLEHKNFIPKMMLLKAWRPEFRDNFKVQVESSEMKNLLNELKEAGKKT